MAAPVEFTNEMLPVHDAAVPLAGAAAMLTTLICVVSVSARPTGGKLNCSVKVVDPVMPCAIAQAVTPIAPITSFPANPSFIIHLEVEFAKQR
jgi:hypothetical protein